MHAITDQEFNQLAQYIQANYGIYLKKEKKTMLCGRLSILLQQLQIDTFSDYFDYIMSDGSGLAAASLINKVTTNHTFFMREAEHFKYMKERVLPALIAGTKEKDLRIWSAGCSTGEEPYTLAMLINEALGQEAAGWDAKLLATDISEQALAIAAKGMYDSESITPLPKHWRSSYFVKKGAGQHEVCQGIKNEVIFRRFNLMDRRFPFKRKFQVIFCRTVMIYFDQRTKRELIDKFYQALDYGGYLFIGHSETIPREQTRFTYVMPAVYRKDQP